MNPHEVLGVAANAPLEEIHRAYLRLARRYHPDFFLDAPAAERAEAEARMRAANDAWAVLGDPERRRTFEATRPPEPFRPFSPAPADEPDPRDAPDIPYRVSVPTRRDRFATLAPVVLFGASVVIGVLGGFLRLSGLIALALVLFVLACIGFLVVPLLAMSRARQDEG